MNIATTLLCDFYKVTHAKMYPKGLEYLTSYLTPRHNRIKEMDKVVFFGLQGFISQYLIEHFNAHFFSRNWNEVEEEYKSILNPTIGENAYDLGRVKELHDLGYLPLEIEGVPEGTLVSMQVPVLSITNTHPNFAWLVNAIETPMSSTLWHSMISATVGYQYKKIAKEYHNKTVDNAEIEDMICDFSMRGQESIESAIKSSAGFLLSFRKSATVPAMAYLSRYYDTPIAEVGKGGVSTEHSVMCSNYCIDGDEVTFVKRLLTEIFPKENVSIVSDSYNFWNFVTNVIPQCKDIIESRDATVLIRPDSGPIVEMVAGGDFHIADDRSIEAVAMDLAWADCNEYNEGGKGKLFHGQKCEVYNILKEGVVYTVAVSLLESSNGRGYNGVKVKRVVQKKDIKVSDYGTVHALWNIFGGKINSKGYKVLPDYIRVIYGDSVTQNRAKEIYERLEKKGFAANNVVLGSGSFSMQGTEVDDGVVPYTRDTYSVATKTTWGKMNDGREIFIHKDPKTDSKKKSHKGKIHVSPTLEVTDSLTNDELVVRKTVDGEAYIPYFTNGKIVRQTLAQIRETIDSNI